MNTRRIQLLLLIILLLKTAAAFAQVTPITIADQVPANNKVNGRGISNEKTGEMILMACIGTESKQAEPDCNTLRLLRVKRDKSLSWMGNAFSATDEIQMQEKLKKWYSEKSVDGIFEFLKGDRTYALSDDRGWNWENNPLQLRNRKYDRVVATVLYFAEYQHSTETERLAKVGVKVEKPIKDVRIDRNIFAKMLNEDIFSVGRNGIGSCIIVDDDHYFRVVSNGRRISTPTAYYGTGRAGHDLRIAIFHGDCDFASTPQSKFRADYAKILNNDLFVAGRAGIGSCVIVDNNNYYNVTSEGKRISTATAYMEKDQAARDLRSAILAGDCDLK